MSANRTLSACPDCGAAIRPENVLIEYESASTGPVGYAECPDCRAVVKVSV